MKRHIADNELNELPTKKMYNIFIKEANTSNCPSIEQKVKTLEKSNPGFHKVSDRIHKALCYVYKQNEENKFVIANCDYLYFWLADLVYSNLVNRKSSYTVMNSIKHFLQNSKGQDICKYDKYNNNYINENNFMDIKTLFDYTKDYDRIKNDLYRYSSYCNREYKDLLDKYKSAHNTICNTCETKSKQHSYCKDFNEFLTGKKKFELTTPACTVQISAHELEQMHNEQKKSREHNKNQADYPHGDINKSDYITSNNPSAT
ncbi:variable surface protein, partial [Plasmodium gonderi]